MSNILKVWTSEAQQKLLDGVGEKLTIYRDDLRPGQRKRKDVAALVERAAMLAPTGRRSRDEVIYLPCFGNFAWDQRDLAWCFAAARERGATLVALNTGIRVPPGAGADTILEAQKAFSDDKRRGAVQPGRAGYEIAAEVANADTKRRTDLIKEDWGNPAFSQEELLVRAGSTTKRGAFRPMSWRTAMKHLPNRRWLLKQRAGIAKAKMENQK